MAAPSQAFFIECSSPWWLDVAGRLMREHGWTVGYWTAIETRAADVAAALPGAVFHPTEQAVRGIPPAAGREWSRRPADPDLLRALAPWEGQVLKMMDRMDVEDSFPLHERTGLYHRLVAYWSAALAAQRPGVVFFSQMPHMIYDYVLYLVCRQAGVATVMLDMSSLPGRLLLLEDLEAGCVELAEAYQARLAAWRGEPAALSDQAEAYWRRLRQDYDQAMPAYQRVHVQKIANQQAAASWKSRLAVAASPRLWAQKLREGRDFLLAPAPPNYLKVKGRRIEDSFMTGLQWRLYRRRRAKAKLALGRHYASLTSVPDLDQPFVFAALHYQPEKTTSPQGGIFVHQTLMLELLAESLPPGWWIYAKEAPAQFMPHLRETAAKNPAFYDRLASLPRVRLLPVDLPSFALIDRCRAVATVTGTAGWEAAIRGKPALVFGYAWYRGCEGVAYTPDRASCAAALKRAAAGAWPVDPEKVRLFLQTLEEVGVWGYVENHAAQAAGIGPAENAASLAPAIHAFYVRLRGGSPAA